MRSNWSDEQNVYVPYGTNTDPTLFNVTAPIPVSHLPHESWFSRFKRAITNTIVLIIYKIYQLLGLALLVLLLLLFTHFLLNFFGITTSLFTYWISFLSTPLLLPFNNLLPPLHYSSHIIDVSTLIAMVVYIIAVAIMRRFLRVLVN